MSGPLNSSSNRGRRPDRHRRPEPSQKDRARPAAANCQLIPIRTPRTFIDLGSIGDALGCFDTLDQAIFIRLQCSDCMASEPKPRLVPTLLDLQIGSVCTTRSPDRLKNRHHIMGRRSDCVKSFD